MEHWQVLFVSIYGSIALIGLAQSFRECLKKKNPFGLTHAYRIYGAFVYADMVVFGLFWAIVAAVTLFLHDFVLFLLVLSLFWLVRSIGETFYWISQQFSPINRNPTKNFKILKRVFHNDAVWFVYQIFWQCMTVVFILSSLYIAKLWLAKV